MRQLVILSALITNSLSGQDIAGRWITIDDNTGKQRSVVEITVSNGQASGKIVEIFDQTKQSAVCDPCTDDRKGKKVLGMEIIRSMVRDGDAWEDGTILDPDNGKVYDCKLWVEDGKLQVRGYVAFFFRTQTWLRSR